MTTTEHNHIIKRQQRILSVALNLMFLLRGDSLGSKLEAKIRDKDCHRELCVDKLVAVLNDCSPSFDTTREEVLDVIYTAGSNGFKINEMQFPSENGQRILFSEGYSQMISQTIQLNVITKPKPIKPK